MLDWTFLILLSNFLIMRFCRWKLLNNLRQNKFRHFKERAMPVFGSWDMLEACIGLDTTLCNTSNYMDSFKFLSCHCICVSVMSVSCVLVSIYAPSGLVKKSMLPSSKVKRYMSLCVNGKLRS